MSTTTSQQIVREPSVTGLVGQSIPRLDGRIKVTGALKYTRDIALPRMLHAKVKRSPYPHAKILRIDSREARALPGVKAIITGEDFKSLWLSNTVATPPLARGEVFYFNQSVVAVAAEDPITAEIAASKVSVEYEPLPAVFDAEVAMSEKTPTVITHPGEKTELPNVGAHVRVRAGNFAKALGEADFVFENRYTTAAESHFQMEPLTYLASPDPDGGLTIWGTSSGPHKLQYELAEYLGMDANIIRAKVPLLGGWFGSKEESHVGAICAMLAIKSRRPVRLALTREETLTATATRHPSIIYLKDAVSKSGRILGRQMFAIFNGGAFSRQANEHFQRALTRHSSVDYNIANLNFDAYRVYTNKVPGTSKRGPYETQFRWAIESQMDFIASKLGVDPLEFRLTHVYHDGDENVIGEPLNGIVYSRCLEEVSRRAPARKKGKIDGPWREGHGIGFGVWPGIVGGTYQAMVRVRETGKVEVWADIVDNGQGTLTGIAQIVATEFGVPFDHVLMMPFVHMTDDSETSGIAYGATADRQTVHMGKTVLMACHDAKRRIALHAQKILQCSSEDIIVSGGSVFSAKDIGGRKIKIGELFTKTMVFSGGAQYIYNGEDLVGHATYNEAYPRRDEKTGKYVMGDIPSYFAAAAQLSVLSVNIETGQIKLHKIVSAMDVGRAINPKLVSHQIVGCVGMSLSSVLGEGIVSDNGRILNANPINYKLISTRDIPLIEPVIVESSFPEGPFGAKSAGEAAVLPVASSIRNAIHDAAGIWINDAPITAESVLGALALKE